MISDVDVKVPDQNCCKSFSSKMLKYIYLVGIILEYLDKCGWNVASKFRVHQRKSVCWSEHMHTVCLTKQRYTSVSAARLSPVIETKDVRNCGQYISRLNEKSKIESTTYESDSPCMGWWSHQPLFLYWRELLENYWRCYTGTCFSLNPGTHGDIEIVTYYPACETT